MSQMGHEPMGLREASPLTPSKSPQTFEEWREQRYGPPRRNDLVDEAELRAAFAAGVASQQARIETLEQEGLG